MTDQELFNEVFNRINTAKEAHYAAMSKYFDGLIRHDAVPAYEAKFKALCTLTKDIPRTDFHPMIKAGTRLRVVLASCMGDLCLSTLLDGDRYGYQIRIMPGQGLLTDCIVE